MEVKMNEEKKCENQKTVKKYNNVFDETTSQNEMYQTVEQPLVAKYTFHQ